MVEYVILVIWIEYNTDSKKKKNKPVITQIFLELYFSILQTDKIKLVRNNCIFPFSYESPNVY